MSQLNHDVPEEMKISEIREAYDEEWMAVLVTQTDEYDVPLAGVVLAHNPDKDTLYARARAYRMENPGASTYLFYAGDVIPKGLVVVLHAT